MVGNKQRTLTSFTLDDSLFHFFFFLGGGREIRMLIIFEIYFHACLSSTILVLFFITFLQVQDSSYFLGWKINNQTNIGVVFLFFLL